MRLKVTVYRLPVALRLWRAPLSRPVQRGRASSKRPIAAYSVAPPTPAIVFVCHGFGCKYPRRNGSDRRATARSLRNFWRQDAPHPRPSARPLRQRVPGSTGASVPLPARQTMWRVPASKYMFDTASVRLHRQQPQHDEPAAGARSAQPAAPSRRRCAGSARFYGRWAAAACHRGARRKGQRHEMVDQFLDGRLWPGLSRSCPWSVGRSSTRRACAARKRNARGNPRALSGQIESGRLSRGAQRSRQRAEYRSG